MTLISGARQTMQRHKLETAIFGLRYLLDSGETAESKFQDFFESNPVVFQVLGYRVAHPRLRLPLDEDHFLEPDFLAERTDGLFEIVELKTPQERIIHHKRNRKKFYAKVEEYISQAATYAEYFDDSANRILSKEKYGVDVQKHPDMIVVVGRDDGVDSHELHKLVRRRTGSLQIVTFDYVLSRLLYQHAAVFGSMESLKGAALAGILTLHRVDVARRQYIFDAGDSLNKNRWSIYLDTANNLVFEITDRSGQRHSVAVSPGDRGFLFDSQFYLWSEFGNSDSFALIQLHINDNCAARLELNHPIQISAGLDFNRRTIGADIAGENHATMTMAGLAIYDKVLSFHERMAVSDAIISEFFTPASATLEESSSIQAATNRIVPNTSSYLVIGNQRAMED